MSTRSRFGIKLNDNTVRSIYIHWDGYPEGVGKDLIDLINAFYSQHYGDYEIGDMLEDFLMEGDRSTVEQSYVDRGEYTEGRHPEEIIPDAPSQDHDINKWPDSDQEYEYLFDCEERILGYRQYGSDDFKLLEEF